MNKVAKFLFFVFIFYFLIIIRVDAAESTPKLFAINESASTVTDMFTYNGLSYVYDQKSDSSQFVFNSIVNNTDSSQYVSIDILLFNKDKKNIGFATYCSEKDLDGDFSQFKLKSKEAAPFNIKVLNKYYVEGNTAKDIAYYSVLDENPYCHIGGYDKYKGLTIEEISKGKISDSKKTVQQEFINLSGKINYTLVFTLLVIMIVSYVVTGIILNELNKRMNATSSPIAYLPIGNNYLAVNLAFGNIISKIYIILLFISIVLFVLGIRFLYYILTFISSIAFILDLVKLITKKYDLFVFEPVTKNYVNSSLLSNSNDSANSYNSNNLLNENDINLNNNNNDSFSQTDNMNVSSGTGKEIIDLNYSAPEEEGTIPLNGTVNTVVGTVDDNNNENNNENNNNNNNGGSDLSNFYK